MRIYYDQINPLHLYSHTWEAVVVCQWAIANAPVNRPFTKTTVPLHKFIRCKKTEVKKAMLRNYKLVTWRKILDYLVEEGWPEYTILLVDDRFYIVEKYLLQGMLNEVQRNRIC